MKPDLTIGITTWNSSIFLPTCLDGIHKTTRGIRVELETVDNCSVDDSASIARKAGARVEVVECTQAEALNRMLHKARAPVVLLIHADVVLLDPAWFPACLDKLQASCALVSPEDIGCGPMTRPFGKNQPESSFLFFDARRARQCMNWTSVRRLGVRWPRRRLDLYGEHVTHNLPGVLRKHGYTWQPMRVHTSPQLTSEWYVPPFTPEYWDDELGSYRYALGNFYSIDGRITHYHNWFERALRAVDFNSVETTGGSGRGSPLCWLWEGATRFLKDYSEGALHLPSLHQREPQPRSVSRHVPCLRRAWKSRGL